jgi:glucose-1-phosphate thymidylyltransferase
MKRKGIILAGGSGTRLHPLTKVVSKQLLPIYDKPMIYYPLSTLMLAGIRDILIISTPSDLPNFQKLFGDGKKIGINLDYAEQPSPDGLAQALIIAENFLKGSPSALILGDNIFYGSNFKQNLKIANLSSKSTVFAYHVNDPKRYGIVEFNDKNKILSLKEKPKKPKSNYALTGLYFYDQDAPEYAKTLKPSKRGELEITDLNKIYLKKNKLNLQILSRGYIWMDAGTNDSLIEAQLLIQSTEKRQGRKIGCLEEISINNKWITKKNVLKFNKGKINSEYQKYIYNL